MKFLLPVTLTKQALDLGVEVHQEGKVFVITNVPEESVIDAMIGIDSTLVDVLVKHTPRP